MPNLPAVDLGHVLPPKARQIVYAVFTVVLVVGFALDVAIEVNPVWLVAALRTIDGLAPLVLVLAAVNVPSSNVIPGAAAVEVGYGLSHNERHPDKPHPDDY